MPNVSPIAADTYFDIYHARFVGDLDLIRTAQPEFVTDAVLEFMEHEVDVLAELVRSSAEFQEPLDTPIHGDLWLNNILWENRDSWHLLDWDDMCIGDPAIDIAMLTGPTPDSLAPLKGVDQLPIALSDAQRQRLLLYGRAALLDWIIDPIADWIEAAAAPALASEVRLEKERMHRQALELYGPLLLL
jgi:aminoglycoside phosphotransferase (APT) family kinase protein